MKSEASWTVAVLATVTAAASSATPTADADDLEFFQTPSGNIGCVIGPTGGSAYAECDVGERTYSVPPRPTSCMGAWGSRISMQQGAAPELACHSDTLLGPGSPVVQYGQSRSYGPLPALACPCLREPRSRGHLHRTTVPATISV
ncbi:hypothetical protein [Mycobacterium bourgelatii]|uniref:Secreted protein n=1 Tax=Mycobacterium bourgelatii TaxID=1273442 RepID=A0A7I9YN21_MYCBU|nr:hypothetical protein [Mycobacterium bourgelatii]MCV6976938.1 hypothetical protein [Mycobacterium bourgelatii]GFG90081.1 hypothetical protein MBOU_21230 [Mycobacterium bourgelatii]